MRFTVVPVIPLAPSEAKKVATRAISSSVIRRRGWVLPANPSCHCAQVIPVAFARGSGHELFTADGTAYVDLGGASHGVANFGHSHPRIVEAMRRQAGDLIHVTMTIPSPVRGDLK